MGTFDCWFYRMLLIYCDSRMFQKNRDSNDREVCGISRVFPLYDYLGKVSCLTRLNIERHFIVFTINLQKQSKKLFSSLGWWEGNSPK